MSTELSEIVEYGPAMNALTPMRRAFVVAYCTNGCDATAAARDAGWQDTGSGAIRVTAHRTLHRPDVRAAIREWTIAAMQAKLPIYRTLLEEVAENVQHKDQTKAILALMDRGGLPAVTERNVNVNVTVTKAEKIAEIRKWALETGQDPQELLGDVSDAEFEEVSEFEFDPEAY